MSQQPQMNMGGIGGPVGGGGTAPPMNAGTPTNPTPYASSEFMIKRLNTAIYDYMLRNKHYDAARSFHDAVPIETKTEIKQSPHQRPGQLPNGVDDGMDVEGKDDGIAKRPQDLPIPASLGDGGSFLQDWWCQFWEIFNAHREKDKMKVAANTKSYIEVQRHAQSNRLKMDPNSMQNLRGYNNMMGGINPAGMPHDLKRAAMQNQRNMTPQQQMAAIKNMNMTNAQQAQMMQGQPMERRGSQMEMAGPRSGSPGSGEAPSPKRPRLEGNMQPMGQGRPGQPGQMQGNQTVQVYAKSMQQTVQAAMRDVNKPDSDMNKGMHPNMGPGGTQGSPMSQPAMDANSNEFYLATNARGMSNQAAVAAAAGQGGGNHALQDYQMQLMLLEQQNKKRLLMARQEQDSMAQPAGVAQNGSFGPGASPQGSQRGGDPSPNPNDMQRGSPTPGMIDPSQMPPNMRSQLMPGANGPLMRPPSSHPMSGQFTSEQLQMMRTNMPNGQFPQQPPPGQMMPGQQPPPGGQPGQPQPIGTPRQQNTNMPPPPAPQANAGSTQPSSPAQQPAPPTPNQATKAKPGAKKDTKASKAAANKKGGANTGATPASESEQPPTPTPATPITPMHANSFNHKQNSQLPNGQPHAPPQQNQQANNGLQQPQAPPNQHANAAPQPPPGQAPDMNAPFGSLESEPLNGMLDFASLEGGDVLDNFDFDTFLNNDSAGDFSFDANVAFDGDGSLHTGGIEGAN